MKHPLNHRVWQQIANKLHTTLTLLNEYLELKIKKEKGNDKDTNN